MGRGGLKEGMDMRKAVLVLAVILAVCAFSLCFAESVYSAEPLSPLWNTYDPELHWYYGQLNAREKQAFSSRYDAYATGDGALWDISGFGLSDREQERVEFAVNCDCPELMTCDFITPTARFFSATEDYEWFVRRRDTMQEELDACLQEINRLTRTAEWGTTDLSREQAFDLHVARETQYLLDNNGPEGTLHLDSEVRTAKSALVNRTAVCEGFSNSTQLAMRCSGIPCIYVHGTVTGGGNHAWNILRIDGNWYHYDATWNGNGGYMNLSDAEIRKTRSLSDDYERLGFVLPACGGASR